MMRYQRVSPDCLPLTNGSTKKPYLRPSPSRSNENGTPTVGIRFNGGAAAACTTTTTSIINSSSTLDGVPKGFRFRSPSTTQQQDLPNDSNSNPSRRSGDILLQWGQRRRSRVSRTEIRSTTTATATAADDSSSSSGQSLMPSNKLQRRSVNPSMPPPPPPPPPQSNICNSGGGRSSTNTRNGFVVGKESSRFIPTRHLEDRSANGSASRNIVGGSRMVSRSGNATGAKRSPTSPNKTETRSSGRDQHHHNQRQLNGFVDNHNHHHHNHHHQRINRSESTAQIHLEMEINNGEKTTQLEVIEWPRIYIALSRKEKEEDFLVMKGTKLPHRPRKRPRNVDKTLQYCFPGLSLSDVNKSRYEVREKKSVKKVILLNPSPISHLPSPISHLPSPISHLPSPNYYITNPFDFIRVLVSLNNWCLDLSF